MQQSPPPPYTLDRLGGPPTASLDPRGEDGGALGRPAPVAHTDSVCSLWVRSMYVHTGPQILSPWRSVLRDVTQRTPKIFETVHSQTAVRLFLSLSAGRPLLSSSSSIILTGLSGPRPRPTTSQIIW
jgi:hypothetical protein